MNAGDHETDLILAQELCAELRSGNGEAILKIYSEYHPLFLGYTRRRIRSTDYDKATSVLSDFWVELLNAKAICNYKGLASLKTYLFKILNFRIVDNVRSAYRQSAYGKNISDKDHEIDEFGSDDESPEKDMIQKEKIKLVHEALLMLADISFDDAYLLKMHLEGLDYRQMAERSIGDKDCPQKELDKKINAIKKQFTRNGTGSLAKFKSCLERVMIKNKLNQDDIFN
ncbi:MAG: sigma-70 family RNA polymerase sigma factor [Desulfobacterales bacterium]